ncbi:FkbM family methyltransferase [Dehalococcoides mccartyi]|nr:FkbM family methyltransferase [Dehalococcoides mccartyi]
MTLFRRAKNLVSRKIFKLLVRTSSRTDLHKFGTLYGGWIVPADLLTKDSVCYLAGVGEDISFDLEIIEQFGCTVYAIDPTPKAIAYVEAAETPSRFNLLPVGLWSSDTDLRFYAPTDPSHVSHSIVNLQETTDYFVAPVRSLVSLMAEQNHDHIALLKIDIEGAEYEVIDHIISSDVDIKILCIEFDQPTSMRKMITYVRRLQKHGYSPVAVDAWNVTFVLSR